MKTNIALVGFMGTGKTTVGNVLAARLGKEFIETDAMVERKTGKKIAQIFAEKGEPFFRDLETEAVKEAAARTNVVIACGGGVVLNPASIDRLKQNGIVVLLEASQSEVLKRTAGDTGRPLLTEDDRSDKVRKLMDYRKPFYTRAADITIDTTDRSIDAIVDEILERVKYESRD